MRWPKTQNNQNMPVTKKRHKCYTNIFAASVPGAREAASAPHCKEEDSFHRPCHWQPCQVGSSCLRQLGKHFKMAFSCQKIYLHFDNWENTSKCDFLSEDICAGRQRATESSLRSLSLTSLSSPRSLSSGNVTGWTSLGVSSLKEQLTICWSLICFPRNLLFGNVTDWTTPYHQCHCLFVKYSVLLLKFNNIT